MRVLIIEDEYLIGMDAAGTLQQAGCEVVGIAGSVPRAMEMLAEGGCDVALLDANLNGASAEPVAAALKRRGIPFLVVSGYHTIQWSGALADAPLLSKPYKVADLTAAVFALQGSCPVNVV